MRLSVRCVVANCICMLAFPTSGRIVQFHDQSSALSDFLEFHTIRGRKAFHAQSLHLATLLGRGSTLNQRSRS